MCALQGRTAVVWPTSARALGPGLLATRAPLPDPERAALQQHAVIVTDTNRHVEVAAALDAPLPQSHAALVCVVGMDLHVTWRATLYTRARPARARHTDGVSAAGNG